MGSIVHAPHCFSSSPDYCSLAELSMQDVAYGKPPNFATFKLRPGSATAPPQWNGAVTVNLPDSVKLVKLHWTPPEAFSGGCSCRFLIHIKARFHKKCQVPEARDPVCRGSAPDHLVPATSTTVDRRQIPQSIRDGLREHFA